MKPIEAFYLVGRVFSPLYSRAIQIRAVLYENDVFKTEQLPFPVISVGNLTMGGTGKTPMVRYICRLLRENGLRPAVISRGYGGKANSPVNIVSDETSLKLSPEQAGDEPYMLASSLPKTPVLTGKKRIFPCRYAIEKLRCNILILDDGFQHMAVRRDLNIVLFNSATRIKQLRVFPGGELREPFTALGRADAFVITGVESANKGNTKKLQSLLGSRHPGKPLYLARNSIEGIFDSEGRLLDKAETSMNYLAVSGIAHPERFITSLQHHRLSIVDKIFFNDHAHYSTKTIEKIEHQLKRCGAQALITTEKDICKLCNSKLQLPIHYLGINTIPDDSFRDMILKQPAISNLLTQ